MIASNHVSNLDPPMIGSALPGKMRFFAKQELFTNRHFGKFIFWVGAIPVDRQQMTSGQFKKIIKILRDEHESMLMFPAGTRNGTVPKAGISLLAYQCQVDVLPVYIEYPKKFWQRLRIYIGKEIITKDYLSTKPNETQTRQFAQLIWEKITDLPIKYNR